MKTIIKLAAALAVIAASVYAIVKYADKLKALLEGCKCCGKCAEAPAEEVPAEEAPVETPAEEVAEEVAAPVEEAPAEEAEETPVEEAPAEEAPADEVTPEAAPEDFAD